MEAGKGWMSRDGRKGIESHAYQNFIQNSLRSSRELVSILWGKTIFWSKPEFEAKKIQYKDLYFKVLQNSEADFFF